MSAQQTVKPLDGLSRRSRRLTTLEVINDTPVGLTSDGLRVFASGLVELRRMRFLIPIKRAGLGAELNVETKPIIGQALDGDYDKDHPASLSEAGAKGQS